MAILRSVKPRNTYREWLLQVLKTVTPDRPLHPKKIEVVFDNYSENSIKIGAREKRGTSAKRVHLQGVEQKQLQGNVMPCITTVSRNHWMRFNFIHV